jgi:cytochrome c biogenesis protein CcmG/thiol:disulfide interchange protein DsbE
MRRRVGYHITTFLVILGLLFPGKTATASERLFEAMGMAKLPGRPTTDFTLPNLEGKQVSLRQYLGKMVFLNFWATWCIPCREEMPAMEQLHQTFHSQGLVILAVNLKERPEQVKAFFDQHRLSFAALLDTSGSVFRDYQVMGLPTTYLISREGTLLARGVGGRDWTRAEGKQLIKALLTGASAEAKPEMRLDGGN